MTRYERLLSRRFEPSDSLYNFSANEAYERIQEGENTRYALGAMQPIKPEYTANTFKECNRVENQLQRAFSAEGLQITFDHQGSVTNDTHIKARSDIDLLTVIERFCWIEPPNKPQSVYEGDPVADLRTVRNSSSSTLTSRFPEAKVTPGSKSIKISGGSLSREIDVVACAWWHTVEFVRDSDKNWLGIVILDNDRGCEIKNKPFLHNTRIDHRDTATSGNTRKAIRLLKSLRYDSEGNVELSSYDIVGIVYNMYDHLIQSVPDSQGLLLLDRCDQWLNVLEWNEGVRSQIEVPNSTRKVFCNGGATLTGLRQLRKELTDLYSAVKRELAMTYRTLEEVIQLPRGPYRPGVLAPGHRSGW